MREEYSVKSLCAAFEVSKSGYYEWLKRPIKAMSERDRQDAIKIRSLYEMSGGTWGAKRIAGTLKVQQGYIINHKRVARLMKEMNIKSVIRAKKSTALQKEQSAGFNYSNHLNRDFTALFPNQKWVTDMSEISVYNDKFFVSAMMDLYNREVIALQISDSPNMDLIEKTILAAKESRGLNSLENVVIHSDQGSVYKSFRYNQLSEKLSFSPSMSRKANCWDNAVIESFFSHLKTEFPCLFPVETIQQVMEDIPKFICYFNEQRSQKRLGYLSPSQFLATKIS